MRTAPVPEQEISRHDDDLATLLQADGITEEIRYDHARGQWHYWNKWRWQKDATAKVYNIVYRHTKALLGATQSESKAKALISLYDQSKKESVLKTLASRPDIAMVGDEWDTQPWLVGCRNGTLDLRDLSFHTEPHPEWLVTRSVKADWNPDARCPLFEKFLREIMSGDEELVMYLLHVLGYSLFGWQREQKFWMFVGQGQNGKGTLAKVMAYVLGEYSDSPSAELYMKTRMGASSASAPRAELVKLQGIRFAWMSEPQGGAFNDELVKAHTGDDPIQARPLYSNDFITFRPTHTIVFLTNDPPRTEDVGLSMRRRARLIRFLEDFTGDREDKTLEEKLRAEADGILQLLAACAQSWALGNMVEPQKVSNWSSDYIEENDPIARFVQERCVVDYGVYTSGALLYDAYVSWCRDLALEPKSQTGFGIAASKRFKKEKGHSGAVYKGIGLKGAMTLAMEGADDAPE